MTTLTAPEMDSYVSARPKYADVPFVAKYLGMRESTLYQLVRENRMPPALKIGKLVRFDMDRLEEWLQAGGSLSEEK